MTSTAPTRAVPDDEAIAADPAGASGADVVAAHDPVLSAFAVGSLGGSLVAARMAFHAVGTVGTVGIGVSLVVLALDVPVAVLVSGALLAGILNANVLVSYLALRTQLSPDALFGRVGATARTVSVGMMPIGALVAGALLDALELSPDRGFAGRGPAEPDPFAARLRDGAAIEVPVYPWPRDRVPGERRRRLLRVSAHLHNDAGEYEHLADALRAAPAEEER